MGISYAWGGVNGLNPSTVGGTGTGVFYFPCPPSLNVWNSGAAGVNTGITSNQLGGTPSSSSFLGQLSVPGNGVFNGQKFTVTASGNVLFGAGEASTTATIKVNANTGTIATPVIVDLLGTAVQFSNVALDGVYLPWTVSLTFQGDTQSGIVGVYYSAMVNGTLTAPTHVAALTGINFNGQGSAAGVGSTGAANYAFGLAAGIQFGASNSGNSANLFQFQLFAE